ncbi:AbrB/MazE/SpoVT family DNA-binding domain-containing protein [Nanoarchaeota archaeon]
MIKLKMGARGEIVIPKKVREYIGLSKDRKVILSVKGKSLEIKPAPTDIVQRWEAHAKELDEDVGDWLMGDDLYKEVF